jgi:hypothetical protein
MQNESNPSFFPATCSAIMYRSQISDGCRWPTASAKDYPKMILVGDGRYKRKITQKTHINAEVIKIHVHKYNPLCRLSLLLSEDFLRS